MITPHYLQQGDTVGIIAPARKISIQEIQPAVAIFKKWGLKVVLSENLFKENHQFAGTDEERTADLQKMLDDTSIKAIFCARGGYGTLRIIDKINFTLFQKNPKWLIGFSDITVLHAHIHAQCGIETIHAAMPINFKCLTSTLFKEGEEKTSAIETLRKTLFGEKINYQISAHPLNRKGTAEGILVGGNLSLLYALQGSISALDTKNKILFIEDLDEYLYHIDRIMLSLKRAEKLKHLAGLIVGGMSEMKDNSIPFGKTAEEIIRETVNEFDYPVCFGFPAGHIEDNRAIILGRKIKLTVTDVSTEFQEF